MIDPLETAIRYLASRSELANLSGRISSKHKYGEDWTTSQSALVLILDDSDPNLYVPVHDARLEVWCMAATDEAAMDLWMTLVGLSRDDARVPVTTSKGIALMYSFLPESGPSYMPVEDLDDVKRVLSFWRIQVNETAVG